MRKIYFKLFTALYIASILTACKLDPPIYPDPNATATTAGTGTGANTSAGTGTSTTTGTGTTATGTGLPLGAVNTVLIKINGTVITYNRNVSFTTFFPGTPQAILSPTTGQTTIAAFNPNNATDVFTLSFLDSKTGLFDLVGIVAGSYSNDPLVTGKVKITALTYANSKGTLQGTFNCDMVDANGNSIPNCPGSFNIKE